MHAFKAARSNQVDGGIVGADSDADLGIGGGGAALGGGNVRTALEQLGGHTDGNLGQGQVERRGRDG